MQFGVSSVSIASLRAESNHHSELISQLLFGETFSIINRQGNWWLIQTSFNHLEAWIHQSQAKLISKELYDELQSQEKTYSFDILSSAITNHEHLPIILGSTLPYFDGLSFKFFKSKIVYNGQVLSPDFLHPECSYIEKIALKYLNAPFLWGGRTPFGIDAAGLVQIVFQLCGVRLPHNLQQLTKIGKTLNFIGEMKEGDLAFFSKNGKIDHAGILINNKIMHVDGKVKLDYFDSHGIYNSLSRDYSYQLSMIRRVI